jgi:hypothetical protein
MFITPVVSRIGIKLKDRPVLLIAKQESDLDPSLAHVFVDYEAG